jgi:hypothetical protein
VLGRIILTDLDHPGETLEVEVIDAGESVLFLAVPNTNVQFKLHRRTPDAPYGGTLGGRSLRFAPIEIDTKRTDRRRK